MTTRRAWSIRHRLLVNLLVLLLVGLVGAPIAGSVLMRSYLADRADAGLDTGAQLIGGMMSGRTNAQIPETRLARPPINAALIGIDAAGSVSLALPDLPAGISAADAQEMAQRTAGLAAGQSRRIKLSTGTYAVNRTRTPGLVVVRDGGVRTDVSELMIAISLADDERIVRQIEVYGFGFAICALAVLGTVAAGTLRRGLRPLEQMADSAEEMTHGSREAQFVDPSAHAGAEVVRLGAALTTAFEARRRAEERLRSFVADASHELRTPLTTISGWLEHYAQGGLREPVDMDRAVERMESAVGRMHLLVDELDLLARLDQGRPLERDAVDLTSIVAGVIEDARVVSADRVITLLAGASPVVAGDAPRLEQVFRNIVGNAAQHTPAGTSIDVEVRVDDGDAVVEVIDHGRGIAATDLSRVFERFWRADTSRSRDEGASGLGLAIVEALVHAHSGSVTVDSAEDVGTTVRVRLPIVSKPSGRA